jgi:acetylornithine deacetylase/succinyl-diaminopimelate desuccinylase-like protein
MTEAALAYAAARQTEHLEHLKELIRIPSISGMSVHHPDVRRAAEWLAGHLNTTIGFSNARVVESVGLPLVYAERLIDPAKPTVLVYGHFDVQPIDPIELWKTVPFEPTLIGDSLYARGAVDDKGPTMAALKALESLLATDGLNINIKVLLEGEEESGSESISDYVTNNPAALACDYVLILDTGMVGKDIPTITHSLRGMTYVEITAQGAKGDLHSGGYGGIAPNPLQALAWVLGDLKGRDGHINLPGLYEMLRPLTPADKAILDRQSQERGPAMMAAAGLSSFPGEKQYSAMERMTSRPTFEVHGIIGGFVGEGTKTVIPAEARAKVSLRLAPGQDSRQVFDLLRERVNELAPEGVTMDVVWLNGGEPLLLPLDAPVLKVAAAAYGAEFSAPVEYVRGGGSIPVAALFDSALHAPSVMLGFGLPDDNVHAPNEKFHLPYYYAAIRSCIRFIAALGA